MNDRFLRACRGEAVDRTPIWMMRQAGRYLPEYRKAREGVTMLEAVRNPELAAEITLQPIRRFGFDAAILFSDLTVAFTPMGAPFDIKEGVGPVVEHPIRTKADVDRLSAFDPDDGLGFVMQTIKILKKELQVPLIGFTGAPFTLASYMIEGGPSRDHKLTRVLMQCEPDVWHLLIGLISDVVASFLEAQIRAGVDAIQLFDSWIGVIDEATYREFLLPHMQGIFDRVKATAVPAIHFGTGTSALLGVMQEAGGDVIGVDWRISLTDAAEMLRPTPLQGNLDPAVLLTRPDIVEAKAREIVQEGKSLPGHVFNLGHGIYPETPIANVERLVATVQGSL